MFRWSRGVRGALGGFLRRRAEAVKFYCAGCLVAQLTQRGAQVSLPANWTEQADPHQVKALAVRGA